MASHCCHEEDRSSLLSFKSSLNDSSNRLSSWQQGSQHENCCSWHGIGCAKDSFRFISIDLRNRDLENYVKEHDICISDASYIPSTSLTGKFSASLLKVTHLEYLDLAYNNFQESQIPRQFSELTRLTHLDLSYSNFSTSISTQFTNISSLQFLDLSCTSDYFSSSWLGSSSTKWMRGLVNLKVLRLSGVELFQTRFSEENFSEHISYLSDLRELDLSYCNIFSSVFPIHKFQNLSHLSSLKMNYNYELNSPFPIQLANLTSLSILELSHCNLHGSIPYLPKLKELDVSHHNQDLHVDLTGMLTHQYPKLKKLWISETKVSGSFLHLVSSAASLVSLSASSCSIQGSIPSSFSNFSQLRYLDLSENSMTGDIHSLISNLKYLFFLDMSHNKFQGTIPSCITKLQHLRVFRASGNSFEGNVSLASMINEMNLTTIELSSNRLTVVIYQHLQPYPILRLEKLRLGSCNLKGFSTSMICKFPCIWDLDLSDNNLTGVIPSCLSKLKYLHLLDLSHNNLTGAITSSSPI